MLAPKGSLVAVNDDTDPVDEVSPRQGAPGKWNRDLDVYDKMDNFTTTKGKTFSVNYYLTLCVMIILMVVDRVHCVDDVQVKSVNVLALRKKRTSFLIKRDFSTTQQSGKMKLLNGESGLTHLNHPLLSEQASWAQDCLNAYPTVLLQDDPSFDGNVTIRGEPVEFDIVLERRWLGAIEVEEGKPIHSRNQ